MSTGICFLILPRMHLLDLAGADQVFHEAIDYGADIRLKYIGISDEAETSGGLTFKGLQYFRDIELVKGDYLFVPGAEVEFLLSKRMTNEKELRNWVRNAHSNGVIICSICTGAFFLAMTGLLDGRKCTTHWKRAAELQKKYPAIRLVENILFTEEDNIYTSAGVTAGIDMALYILGKLKDDNFSYKVARELVVYVRRQGAELQQSVFMNYRNHIHSGVHRVQDYLQVNVNKKVTIPPLAEIACMSVRNLTRVFKKETGISINDYMTLIRRERLRALVKNPDISRKEMAGQCGLKSERQVMRLLKAI
jgi:transcriptional regulator GlxA family with amidase domain